MYNKFKNSIRQLSNPGDYSDQLPLDLMIGECSNLTTYYAPFDHINSNAKLVLVGITPGLQQAKNALFAAQSAMLEKASEQEVLERAKVFASFSGPMRTNLVSMLDCIGLNHSLGITSCESLWDENRHLVHFTSALRYPVFKDMNNYSGSPSITRTPFLRDQVLQWTGQELSEMNEAWIVPLGKAAQEAVDLLVGNGLVREEFVLSGLPHPSGANIERIKYFLGQKEKSKLSSKVNPKLIDKAKSSLLYKLSSAVKPVTSSTIESPYCIVKSGPNAGIMLFPHRFEDGQYATSPTKFTIDYVRDTSKTKTLAMAKAQNWKVAMSNPKEGVASRSMVNYSSLLFD